MHHSPRGINCALWPLRVRCQRTSIFFLETTANCERYRAATKGEKPDRENPDLKQTSLNIFHVIGGRDNKSGGVFIIQTPKMCKPNPYTFPQNLPNFFLFYYPYFTFFHFPNQVLVASMISTQVTAFTLAHIPLIFSEVCGDITPSNRSAAKLKMWREVAEDVQLSIVQ